MAATFLHVFRPGRSARHAELCGLVGCGGHVSESAAERSPHFFCGFSSDNFTAALLWLRVRFSNGKKRFVTPSTHFKDTLMCIAVRQLYKRRGKRAVLSVRFKIRKAHLMPSQLAYSR
jgi:hypothetical protein